MSPEQRQEWEDDEEALRRETAAAHPAPESTASDERAARVAKYAGAIQTAVQDEPAHMTEFGPLVVSGLPRCYAFPMSLKAATAVVTLVDSELTMKEAVIEALRARLDLAYRELAEAKREIARLRAGESEDDAPVNVMPTPGQWVKRFNDASADERLAAAERAIANADTVQGHFMRNTNGELIRIRSRAERAEREIAALHRDALTEARAYRAMFARAQEAEAERDQLKRGGRELGRMVVRHGEMVLQATGLHDWIDEDGDGDWAAVWENLAELRPRAEAAEAEVERLRAASVEASNTYAQWRDDCTARAEAAESKLTAVEALRASYGERAENGCPVSLNYARAHRDLTTALGIEP